MSIDDYDYQMIFGDLVSLKLPDICLMVRKTQKKPHLGNLSQPGIESGPLHDRHTCYHLLHSSGWVKGDWDFWIPDLVKNPDETDIYPLW